MRPTTYSLQFRGFATELEGGLRKHGRAPAGALVTSLADGLEGRFVWARDESEAIFESTLAYVDETRFEESGAIRFEHGDTLRLRGFGQLEASPDPDLRQGTVVWTVVGGDGRFEGARGRVASNLLLSTTGDLTETQLGVIFALGAEPAPGHGPGMSPARATWPPRDHRDTARRYGLDQGGRPK